MNLDSLSLYKLMALYMMNKVSFLLNFSQLSSFFIDNNYVNFFTFQQFMGELESQNLIIVCKSKNTQRYKLTDDGIATLNLFINQIPDKEIEKINAYLSANKYKMKSESSIISDIQEAPNNYFSVQLGICENKNNTFSINFNVPDIDTATTICDNWKSNAQNIYNFVIEQLL